MPDVETLRHGVEGKCDQGLVCGFVLLRMCQSPREQFVADAAALLAGSHEQFSKKPEVAADPTEGEAENGSVIFRDPQAIRIVAEGE